MIDQNDITVQVESNAVDVWVPDGLAVPKRDTASNGIRTINLVPGYGIVTSLDPAVKPIVNATTGDTSYRWEKSKTKSRYVDATLNSNNTDVVPTRAQEIGPILLQNRVPIPVRDGHLVKYTGTIRLRRCGMAQKNLSGGGAPAIVIRIMLTAVGYIQDEYGEETAIKFDLMKWTKTLQGAGSGNPGTAFVDFTPEEMEWSAMPAGTTQLFLSVTAHSLDDMNQTTNDGGETRLQYKSGYWFVDDKDFMVLPGAINSRLSIQLRQPRNEPYLYPQSLSTTGQTFRNRSVFSNVYPMFIEYDIENDDFNTNTGWNLTGPAAYDPANSVMRCTTNANSTVNSQSSISVNPNDDMFLEMYVKRVGSAQGVVTGSVVVKMNDDTETNFVIANSEMVNISTTEWTRISAKFKLPATSKSLKVNASVLVTTWAPGEILIDKIFLSKLVDDNTITLMGLPGVPNTAKIYEWNGSRGALLKTVTLPVNTKVTVPISSSTGQIEVAKNNSTTPSNQVDAGVTKTEDQRISRNTWTRITSLAVDKNFLGTVLTNNTIRVPAAGRVAFFASFAVKGTAGAFTKGYRILVNDVVRDTITTDQTNVKGVIGTTAPISVNAGDIVRFEGYSSSIYVDRLTIDKTKTFFRMTYEPQPLASDDIFVESCWANKWENLYQTQTRSINRSYVNIQDDVSSIKIVNMEADTGVLTLRFCSDVLDPATNALLQIGKSIRILGRHYGATNTVKPSNWSGEPDYSVVFTGIIKRIEVTYDYQFEPQITVTAYNCFNKLDSIALGCAYDTMEQYGGALNSIGNPVYIEGVEYTGTSKDIPQDTKFFPSTNGEYSLMDALTLTRNTKKWFVSINNRDELIIRSTLPNTVKAVFTDGTMPGDLSMSDVRMGIDTDSIINIIEIEENLLDRKDFMERSASSDSAPDTLKTVQGKKRTIQYISRDSIARYGEFAKKFQVVRGSGSWDDLKNDNFGSTFENWAQNLINEYAQPMINIASIKVPIKNSKDIKLMSEIEVLDRVYIGYKDEYFDMRVREITHDISPGKWVVELKFQPKNDMTYWNGPDTDQPET